MSIDWNLFEAKYLQLAEGESARIVVNEWKSVTDYKYGNEGTPRAAILCRIAYEQGKIVNHEKYFVTSSSNTAAQLRPILEGAEQAGAKEVSFMVTKKNKSYFVSL